MDACKTRVLLETAFENNNFDDFNRHYVYFLNRFPAFREAFSEEKTGMDVTSALFGRHNFYLKRTDSGQASLLYETTRNASKVFGALSLEERLAFLRVLRKRVEAHSQDIILTITADTGKPIMLAAGEMMKGNEWFGFAEEQAACQLGIQEQGVYKNLARPIGEGVAQIIGPFNYPYALSIGGIVGALAVGDGVVVSANSKSPNWIFPFKQAAQEAVDEFLQTLDMSGHPQAKEFAACKDNLIQITVGTNRGLTALADIVHFVGGDTVGCEIAKTRQHKRTILELGGSNVVIIMASAVNGDEGKAYSIAREIYGGFAPATGQRCTAPRIVCAQTGAEQVAEKLKNMCQIGPPEGEGGIGNPFTDGIKIGPLVDAQAYRDMQEVMALAKSVNAEVCGTLDVSSNLMPQSLNAHWVNPVVIAWPPEKDIADKNVAQKIVEVQRREIFGPLLHIVQSFRTLTDAIEISNRLDSHGLAGAIFTANPKDTQLYRASVKATFVEENKAPKDQSPKGRHGHPGQLAIGGDGHFLLYADSIAPVQ